MAGDSILLVDDDTALRELIAGFLAEHGYRVTQATDVPSMRGLLAQETPDLIVLDLMMPGEDGLAGLRTLPSEGRPPVIMLSALGGDTDRIVGLEMGADDYLPKPCNPRELLARIRAVLRRGDASNGVARVLHFAGWRLNPDTWQLFAPDGEEAGLTEGEFRLLLQLARANRQVLSRDVLAARLAGQDYESYDRYIDIAISRLRRKLARHKGGEGLIRTVRGAGYGMAVPVEAG